LEYSCQEILLNVDYSWKVIRPYSTIVAIIFRRFVIHQIAPGWTPAIRSPMGFSRTTKFIIFPLFVPSPEAKFLRITKHSMSSAIIDSHLRRNTRLIWGSKRTCETNTTMPAMPRPRSHCVGPGQAGHQLMFFQSIFDRLEAPRISLESL